MITISEILLMKGQICTIVTERQMKVKKGFTPVSKTTRFQCRLGINYDDIPSVKAKRDELDEIVKSSLPWGTWKHFPFIIEHKGTEYLRCTTIDNNFDAKAIYMQDDQIITKEEAQLQCYASEFPKTKTERVVFNIKMDSILRIN